jgi:hypothetical protein
MAVGMDEPQVCGIACAAPLLGRHMVDVERLAIFESLVTAGAQPSLPGGESPVAIRRRSESRVPLSPVVLKGRVIGGIGLGDQPTLLSGARRAYSNASLAKVRMNTTRDQISAGVSV